MSVKWVNLMASKPVASNFNTTQALGTPICIDGSTGTAYYLSRANVVTPIAVGELWNLAWFGVVGDNVTDNYTIIQGAINALAAIKMNSVYGYGYGSPGLFLPAAREPYYCSQKLIISHTMRFVFENGEGAAGGCSVLRYPANQGGILLKDDAVTGGAAGSLLERPMLYGAFTTTEGEYHGIEFQVACRIVGAKIFNFQGDGIFADTHLTGFIVNGSVIDNSFTQACRNGMYINGEDAQALTILNPQASSNRRYNHWQKLTLGSVIVGGSSSTAGQVGTGGSVPYCFCSNGAFRYFVLPNQDVAASTTAPPAGATSNTVWGYFSAGGAVTGYPLWVSGTQTFRAGGAARFEGSFEQNVLCAYYYEPDQAPIQVDPAAQMLFIGGISGNPINFNGSFYAGVLTCSGGTMRASGKFTCLGDFKSTIGGVDIFRTASDGSHFISPVWIAPDQSAVLEIGRYGVGINAFLRPDSSAPALEIRGPDNATTFTIFSGGIAEYATSLRRAGTKVLGAQGAAVADAVNAAAAPTQAEFNAFVTQFNLLLARVRAATGHGLIA